MSCLDLTIEKTTGTVLSFLSTKCPSTSNFGASVELEGVNDDSLSMSSCLDTDKSCTVEVCEDALVDGIMNVTLKSPGKFFIRLLEENNLLQPLSPQENVCDDNSIQCITCENKDYFQLDANHPTLQFRLFETNSPTTSPTSSPSTSPTPLPTSNPTSLPTLSPTISPTSKPSASPTFLPTTSPTLSLTLDDSRGQVVIFAVFGAILAVIGVLILFCYKRRNKRKMDSKHIIKEKQNSDSTLPVATFFSKPLAPEDPTDTVFVTVPNDPRNVPHLSVGEKKSQKNNFLRFSQTSTSNRSNLSNLLQNGFSNRDSTALKKHLSARSAISAFTVRSYKSNLSQESLKRNRQFRALSANLSENYSRVNELLGFGGDGNSVKATAWDQSARQLVSKVYDHLKGDILSAAEVRDLEKMNLGGRMSSFAGEASDIDLEHYLFRLVTGLNKWFEDESDVVGMRSLMFALIYLRKIRAAVPLFGLTVFNVHRLFAVLTLVAAKFTEDELISNNYWADVSGFPMEELNQLEETFCFSSEFDFFVTPDELEGISEEFELTIKTRNSMGLSVLSI